MDTGKRNHMQRHSPAFSDRKKGRDGYGLEDTIVDFSGTRRNPFHISSCRSLIPIQQIASPIAVIPATTLVHTAPAAMTTVLQTIKTDEVMARGAIASEIEILSKCKHVDRKRNREACPGNLRIRNHKRGYLAVVCDRGHQWVWCSCCCDCERSGIGCSAMQHWMERDSFDTGRRNHMQRHVADYDANNDLDGAIMAEFQPRQVAMSKHSGGGSDGMSGSESLAGCGWSDAKTSYAASIHDSPADRSAASDSSQAAASDGGGGPAAVKGGSLPPEGAALVPPAALSPALMLGLPLALMPSMEVGGGAIGACGPAASVPVTAALLDRLARRDRVWAHLGRRGPATKRLRSGEGSGCAQREPIGAALSAPGFGPCGPSETARDEAGRAVPAPSARPGPGEGSGAGDSREERGEDPEELNSVGAAAVALIALRRSVRINGADE